MVAPPGVTVTVQVPEVGNPVNCTEPVGTAQVGCVMVPIPGALGIELTVAVTAVLVADTQPVIVFLASA